MPLTRRQIVAALGAAPASLLIHRPPDFARLMSICIGRRFAAHVAGRPTPQAAQKPLFVESRLKWRNLTGGYPNLHLELIQTLVGKRVDVWHADAIG